ncbi:MAG: shikimate dehydrogenase [Desulfobacterales bacterium]|nr:shikimate dehydrogenase [Desulfobacterales bacterium]MDD4393496.1 shikimate dehydrogenase [Desulfobacterales bacterium]
MINSNTSLYAVIGNPVFHSMSPVMHNSAFQYVGYDGVYTAFTVTDIESAVTGIRALGIRGVSVTIPHKVSVMKYLDDVDCAARAIGAVNTIINRDQMLIGYNSDGLGAVRALEEHTSLRGKTVAILGAGGAARAIGHAVMAEGGHVTLFNRTAEAGKKLAADLGADFCPLSDNRRLNCQVLINTTPVGMIPETEAMPIRAQWLEKDMIVMDIVYHPLKTRLLREAQRRGCITIDGLSMFVYQGAFQFELWTGKKAPVEVMRKAVLQELTS